MNTESTAPEFTVIVPTGKTYATMRLHRGDCPIVKRTGGHGHVTALHGWTFQGRPVVGMGHDGHRDDDIAIGNIVVGGRETVFGRDAATVRAYARLFADNAAKGVHQYAVCGRCKPEQAFA